MGGHCGGEKQTREISDRVKKHNEIVVPVHNHFYDSAGLQAELLDAGAMDPNTYEVDPWRLLQLDECPNFIDFNSEKGNSQRRVVAGPGDPCVSCTPENRDSITNK